MSILKRYDTNYYFDFINRGILLLGIILFSGCASVPEIKPTADRLPMVSYALSLQGAPYRYGKSSPDEGFDCSGFVKHVYEHQGISLPRTSQGMAQSLAQVPKNELHSGDLVFFNTNGNFPRNNYVHFFIRFISFSKNYSILRNIFIFDFFP